MLSRLNKIDIALALLALLTAVAFFWGSSDFFKLLLWGFIVVGVVRILSVARRRFLWKIRNRLIFSALFLVVTPLFLITIFFIFIANVIIAQYGTVIIDNIMEEKIAAMDNIAMKQLNFNNPDVTKLIITRFIGSDPTLFTSVFWKKNQETGVYEWFHKYPKNFDETRLVKAEEFNGFFMVNDTLYHGVLRKSDTMIALVAFAITQEYLEQLYSISDFKVLYRNPRSLMEGKPPDKPSGPVKNPGPNAEVPDTIFPFVYEYNYHDFDYLEEGNILERQSSFVLSSDSDKIYDKIEKAIAGSKQGTIRKIVYALIVLFGTFTIISFIIGFRMVRVITRSINQLTKGTQRIRNGDFSFRIKTRSGDQLQYLGECFNEMAAGIDRLLVDEKEKHRLEEELRIARSIQLKLLPDESFATNDFEIAAVNIPAAEVAGDYFDYFYKEKDYLTVLVADVSGKGSSAAFYMAELKGVINHLQREVNSPAKLISECHYSLKDTFDRITFITMNIAQFRIPEKKFVLARAGHNPAIFYSAQEKKCSELYPAGMGIGLCNFSSEKLEEIELPYQSGDILFLFSDGLTEIMNDEDEMLGVDHLKRLIRQNHQLTPEELKSKILEFSMDFSSDGIARDDLTFIILKVH